MLLEISQAQNGSIRIVDEDRLENYYGESDNEDTISRSVEKWIIILVNANAVEQVNLIDDNRNILLQYVYESVDQFSFY